MQPGRLKRSSSVHEVTQDFHRKRLKDLLRRVRKNNMDKKFTLLLTKATAQVIDENVEDKKLRAKLFTAIVSKFEELILIERQNTDLEEEYIKRGLKS